MGRPKALVQVDGTAMAARVSAALRAGGATAVVLVGGDPAWAHALGLGHIPDRWPGQGPLGAIATAVADAPAAAGFTVDTEAVVVVAACDQPWLTGAVVADLAAATTTDGARAKPQVAVAFGAGRRRQPFPSAWPRQLAGPLVHLFEQGARRADAGFAVGEVVDVTVAADLLADVDTPADLARGAGGVQPGRLGPVHSEPPHQPTTPGAPAMDTESSPIPEIDIAETARRIGAGTAIIDVRQPDEYREAHVPGAPLIPLGDLPARFGEVPDGGQILIICRSGGRSAQAVELLRAQGIDAVNVAGGTMGWIEAGHPVVEGDQPGAGA